MEQELMTEMVPVHCGGQLVDIGLVVPNPDNPNVHPDEQLEKLALILRRVGWREAIVVSKRSGFVVKGHGRLLTAKKMGLKAVPVEYQDYASEAEEMADLIADNRIAQHSYMDALGLGKLLKKLDENTRKQLPYSDEEAGLLMAAEYVPPAPTDRKFQVLETLKMTKEQKSVVGRAVQRYMIRTGKEVEWGEALAKMCEFWEAANVPAA